MNQEKLNFAYMYYIQYPTLHLRLTEYLELLDSWNIDHKQISQCAARWLLQLICKAYESNLCELYLRAIIY